MPTECQHIYQNFFFFFVPLTLHSITLAVNYSLFKIPKSVVIRKFHIQPTLSESIKLPQGHLVYCLLLLLKNIWYE